MSSSCPTRVISLSPEQRKNLFIHATRELLQGWVGPVGGKLAYALVGIRGDTALCALEGESGRIDEIEIDRLFLDTEREEVRDRVIRVAGKGARCVEPNHRAAEKGLPRQDFVCALCGDTEWVRAPADLSRFLDGALLWLCWVRMVAGMKPISRLAELSPAGTWRTRSPGRTYVGGPVWVVLEGTDVTLMSQGYALFYPDGTCTAEIPKAEPEPVSNPFLTASNPLLRSSRERRYAYGNCLSFFRLSRHCLSLGRGCSKLRSACAASPRPPNFPRGAPVTSPFLLDTGPSERGWSWYGDAFRCLHLFALKRGAGLIEDGDALTQGSMGHVAMAHRFARFQMVQEGKDPELYYAPEMALEVWCARHPEGLPFLKGMIECHRRYVAANPEAPGKVLGVETPVAGVVGHHSVTGEWGLWLEGTARAAVLDMPGHPENGRPIRITKRIDAIVQDRSGKVHPWDHKFTAAGVSKSRVLKYSMDAQFAVTRILSKQLLGASMGQVMLHLVQRVDPWNMHFSPVPETPWRDSLFPTQLYRMAHVIAQLQRDEPDPHRWPMAQHEQVCSSRYGDCPGITQAVCSHGAAFMRTI